MFFTYFLALCSCDESTAPCHNNSVKSRYTLNFQKGQCIVLCHWDDCYLEIHEDEMQGMRYVYPFDGYTMFFFTHSGTAILYNPKYTRVSYMICSAPENPSNRGVIQVLSSMLEYKFKRDKIKKPLYIYGMHWYWLTGSVSSNGNGLEYFYWRDPGIGITVPNGDLSKPLDYWALFNSRFESPDENEEFSVDLKLKEVHYDYNGFNSTIPYIHVIEWDNYDKPGYTEDVAIGPNNAKKNIFDLRTNPVDVFSINITVDTEDVYVGYDDNLDFVGVGSHKYISKPNPFYVTIYKKIDVNTYQMLKKFNVYSMETINIHINSLDVPIIYSEENVVDDDDDNDNNIITQTIHIDNEKEKVIKILIIILSVINAVLVIVLMYYISKYYCCPKKEKSSITQNFKDVYV